ncbi:uncharacterized protein [Littorina saxatilis]|uniref:uncharacterized protein n=1 Tax=Littorina saxatilis TaxID=31220 RepID=UPI0038B4DEBB
MRRGGSLGWWTFLLSLICVSSFVPGAYGQDESGCQLPLSLLGTWYRTNTGSPITFNHTAMLGHQLAAAGELFTEFTCEYSFEFQYVFAVRNVDASQVDAYFCWKLVRSTDMSFLLYPLTPTADNGSYIGERVVQRPKTDPVPPVAEVCSLHPDNVLPTMLYKWPSGIGDIDVTQIASSKTQCPNDLLASFDYIKDNSGCSSSDSELDFCKDRATAHVNYTTCGTKILFSEKGVLSCTAFFKYGVSTYAMLVNHDSQVNAPFRRFACMKITKHGDGQSAIVYPGDCSAANGSQELKLYITSRYTSRINRVCMGCGKRKLVCLRM